MELELLRTISSHKFEFILFAFQTSASLKFTVLNPKGRIWTMVAGGGASVIYADTVSAFYCISNPPFLCA